jgi:hypothetical protein
MNFAPAGGVLSISVETPSPPDSIHPPLHTVYVYTLLYSILIHTGKAGEGRANQREG